MDTYFTFPDGALKYDCASCGGACCRGKGIGFDRSGEYETILTKHPSLAYFTMVRGEVPHAFNPQSACWFLDDTEQCTLHSTHGWDNKPAVCRLFPFNRVFNYHGIRVVDYNSVICPLEPAPDGDGIRYSEIEDELSQIEDTTLVSTSVEVGGDPERVIGLERAVAETSVADGTWYGETALLHEVITELWHSTDDPVALMGEIGELDVDHPRTAGGGSRIGAEVARRRKSWRAWFEAARRFLDLSEIAADRVATASEVACILTPSLRFNDLFRTGGPSYRDQIRALPRMMTLWTSFIAEAEELAERTANMCDSTAIWTHVRTALYPLARLLERPTVDDGSIELTGPAGLRKKAMSVVRACHRNRGPKRKPLRTILAPYMGRSISQRLALLYVLEPLWRRATFS